MSQEKTNQLSWEIPEYVKQERNKTWYIIVSSLAVIILFFSFFTFQGGHLEFLGYRSNYLFALIIIISLIIMVVNENQPTIIVEFKLEPEGIKLGNRFYDYDVFKNFSVLYKPDEKIENLYFEFKNKLRTRLSIPLMKMDALEVRNFLARYLEEDLDRTNPPLSEQLTKILKL